MSELPPETFTSEGQRLVVYRAHNVRSRIDDYVWIALRALREHASHIVLTVEDSLDRADLERLNDVVDELIVATEGIVVDELELGERIDEIETLGFRFDEVVLADDSWFGPVSSFAPVFARMDADALDAWTMVPTSTSTSTTDPSSWLAVRRHRDTSSSWAQRLVAVRSAIDAERLLPPANGDRATGRGGLIVADAYPANAASEPRTPRGIVADGCPLLSRSMFTQDPSELERYGVVGRLLVEQAAQTGYPDSAIFQNLARSVAPNRLHANLGMFEIPAIGAVAKPVPPRKLLALAHITQDADTGDLLRYGSRLPSGTHLIVTTNSPHLEESIGAMLAEALPQMGGNVEVRGVPADADHISAVFVGCRDALRAEGYDLIVKMRPGQQFAASANARRVLHRQTWENLFLSQDHTSRVLEFFDEPGLGVMFPPMPHVGFDNLGSGWRGLRNDAVRLNGLLGITVPLGSAPLAPVGGMWIARTAALERITDHPWQWTDYRPGGQWAALGSAQESILTHAAGELGMHTRTVATTSNAAISYAPLVYKVDQLTSTMTGFPADQIRLLQRFGWVGNGGALDSLRTHLRANHPSAVARSGLLRRFVGTRPRSAVAESGGEVIG